MNGLILEYVLIGGDWKKDSIIIRYTAAFSVVAFPFVQTLSRNSDTDLTVRYANEILNYSTTGCEVLQMRSTGGAVARDASPRVIFVIGYQLNGLMIQWGKKQANERVDNNDYQAIFYFSPAFTVPPVVTFSCNLRNLTNDFWIPGIASLTETKVRINTSITNNNSYNVYFIAIGYQLNGLMIQWMLVSVSNREVTLPAPFSNSSSYISIGTIRLTSLSDGRTAYCQIGNISDRTFFVRARMDGTSYNDACYCFFIGY